jgi:hypothetical protein
MPAPEEIPDGLHELMLACFERDLARRPTTVELLEYGWVIDCHDSAVKSQCEIVVDEGK